jgi:hypothetical protein
MADDDNPKSLFTELDEKIDTHMAIKKVKEMKEEKKRKEAELEEKRKTNPLL